MSDNPRTDSDTGRLAYWKMKAELSRKAFVKQVAEGNKQAEAVKNLERFIHAKNQVAILQSGQDMSWLQPTNGDAA